MADIDNLSYRASEVGSRLSTKDLPKPLIPYADLEII
jgi:hypothetical protein